MVDDLTSQVAELRQMVLSLTVLVNAQQEDIGSLKRQVGRLERDLSAAQGVGAGSNATTPSKNGLIAPEGLPMVHRSGMSQNKGFRI
jgi:hypothetical protein